MRLWLAPALGLLAMGCVGGRDGKSEVDRGSPKRTFSIGGEWTLHAPMLSGAADFEGAQFRFRYQLPGQTPIEVDVHGRFAVGLGTVTVTGDRLAIRGADAGREEQIRMAFEADRGKAKVAKVDWIDRNLAYLEFPDSVIALYRAPASPDAARLTSAGLPGDGGPFKFVPPVPAFASAHDATPAMVGRLAPEIAAQVTAGLTTGDLRRVLGAPDRVDIYPEASVPERWIYQLTNGRRLRIDIKHDLVLRTSQG